MKILADKLLRITIEYVGPASEMFLNRQTTRHLAGLKLDDIERKHLPELAKWVKISAGLLIGDAKAEELANKVLDI